MSFEVLRRIDELEKRIEALSALLHALIEEKAKRETLSLKKSA